GPAPGASTRSPHLAHVPVRARSGGVRGARPRGRRPRPRRALLLVTGGFEVGTSAALRAMHRIPWLPPPEGDLHEHDYRVEVVVQRETLDGRGMVCDLDVVGAARRGAVE